MPHALTAAVAEYDFRVGLFEARLFDNGTGEVKVVRLLSGVQQTPGSVAVSEFPRVHGLAARFPKIDSIRDMLATPRRDRVWAAHLVRSWWRARQCSLP